MREYGVVPTIFWSDPAYFSLSPDARLIAVYLLTCSHTNMLGCFRLPEEYIAADLKGLDKKRIKESFQELISADLISVDFTFGWILIHPFLDWSPIENPNQAKHIIKIFEKVSPTLSVYENLVDLLISHSDQFDEGFRNRLETLSEEFRNRSETVPEPFRNQKQNQEQKQNQDQEQNNIICSEPSEFGNPFETVIEIPLNTGLEFQISEKRVEQWKVLYPAVDVFQELRNIRGWNLANPIKRKTKSGILKHINSWLSRAQNNPKLNYQSRSPPHSSSLYERNSSAAEQWLHESEKTIVDGEVIRET